MPIYIALFKNQRVMFYIRELVGIKRCASEHARFPSADSIAHLLKAEYKQRHILNLCELA